MRLTTFGSPEHRDIECTLTHLNVWDAKGVPHMLRLFTYDTLTANLTQGAMDSENTKFIRRKGLHVCSPSKKAKMQPKILIGCDQLWNFIEFEAPHFNLPSGLLLVPTKFGYMITGQKIDSNSTIPYQLPAFINMLKLENKMDHWEQHWDSEANNAGKEYTGPEKEEKARINHEVLEEFNKSIQRKDDGYYVKLPFKKTYEDLPDNRMLAWKRLKSTLQKYTNRIKEVQKVVRDLNSLKILVQFGYIDTNHNPADCGTRGLTKDQFSAHIWWTGHTLKQITENKIARDFVSIPEDEGEELPSSIEMHIRVTENDNSDQVTDILELATFSSYSKAKRILAFALRFLKNTTSRLRGELQSKLHRHLPWLLSNEQGNHLSAKDILDVQHVLIRNHQMSIGRRILTMDQLLTLLTEVEACLNTRPLTYQETDYKDTLLSLRPIDFIQNEIDITLPLTNFEESQDDPSYYPFSEAARLNTHLQTIRALQSSCALSERHWKIWKDAYLTALREQHRRHMSKKRGCNRQPAIGTIDYR
ncbi:hypothetical protein NECAME_10584 [Necator americanus]|uniref:Uncharacterized protein n=1 Tax=Necator americanus TaxID=51031 RepID=W2TA74_NECAM|nr:hypothetical protein NECAME_10584 [Necator americanus]ETN78106.1 hypothetical protein NECAME_10584 [Necator americanus]